MDYSVSSNRRYRVGQGSDVQRSTQGYGCHHPGSRRSFLATGEGEGGLSKGGAEVGKILVGLLGIWNRFGKRRIGREKFKVVCLTKTFPSLRDFFFLW